MKRPLERLKMIHQPVIGRDSIQASREMCSAHEEGVLVIEGPDDPWMDVLVIPSIKGTKKRDGELLAYGGLIRQLSALFDKFDHVAVYLGTNHNIRTNSLESLRFLRWKLVRLIGKSLHYAWEHLAWTWH
jgi:hypothetical protein